MKYKLIAILFGISIMALTACGTNTDSASSRNIVPNTETDTNIQMGEDIQVEWQELGYLETYPEIRSTLDEIIGNIILTPEDAERTGLEKIVRNQKTGTCYVDMNNKWTNNSTLRYGFNRLQFGVKLWDNEESVSKLVSVARETFADVQTDSEALLSAINAYYNLFAMPEGYFNSKDTLTRAEFLTGVYKAHNPVSELEINEELPTDGYNPFVNQMLLYSFVDMKDETNYSGVITRGEAIYTLVKMYYKDDVAEGDVEFLADSKDGGEISLSDAIQNPDNGMPSEIYKALVIAEFYGVLDGTESRWDEALTKKEALELITKVYSESNLANSIEFNNASETENKVEVKVEEQVKKNSDGKLVATKALGQAINNSLASQGLSKDYGNNILNKYYAVIEGKNNTIIHEDLIDSLVIALKQDIKAYEVAQQQAEQQKQEQSSSNKNNNSSNKNNNSSSNKNNNSSSNKNNSSSNKNNNSSSNKNNNIKVEDDGYVYEDNNQYPSGNIYQEEDAGPFQEDKSGDKELDFWGSVNRIEGDGGEIVGEIELKDGR